MAEMRLQIPPRKIKHASIWKIAIVNTFPLKPLRSIQALIITPKGPRKKSRKKTQRALSLSTSGTPAQLCINH